ncbi:MAG TPA: glycosyltransferase [Verrucomicrobiae bacterium]|nr:glycosyltransferase [Verrucomicrobiae bacterium]
MADRLLKIAWISSFPIERLSEVPEMLRGLPPLHPSSWQRVLLDGFQSRADLKIHVLAVRRQFPRLMSFESDGVTFHCIKIPRGMRTLSLFWWETLRIRRCLRQIRPNLVHAWGTERGAALVASRLHYPYLVTMQGLLEWYQQQVPGDWLFRLEARIERIALRRASVVTTESTFGVNWIREHHPHLKVLQVEHAPAWVFHRVQRQPITKPIQFLYVGSLLPLKGTDLLLRALDKIRDDLDFRLTMVGTPAPGFIEQIKTATSKSLWDRVNLRRGLSPPEVAAELARTTMLLFPTRADTSPNAVKEAVVAGVPVIGSAVGGINDYVVPEKNGLTFPVGDLDAFLEAIRRAVSHPLFSQGAVNAETLANMRSYLSPLKMADGFVGAYREVLGRYAAR